MRAIVQRVLNASVVVDGQKVAEIGPGVMALVGMVDGDSESDMEHVVSKLKNLRLWANEAGKEWNASVSDLGKDILVGEKDCQAVVTRPNSFLRIFVPQCHNSLCRPLGETAGSSRTPPLNPPKVAPLLPRKNPHSTPTAAHCSACGNGSESPGFPRFDEALGGRADVQRFARQASGEL
jgi:hypothetical protein